MSDIIRADANCYIYFSSASDNRGRLWVAGTETRRDRLGNLVLEPLLNASPRNAQRWKYETALIAARRFSTEGVVPAKYATKITLEASDTSSDISSGVAPVTQEDRRVPMHYKGLLAVPGRDVRTGEECWYVRFPGQTIESIRGSSPEEAVDRVFERNLQDKAEKFEAPPVPEPPAPQPRRKFSGRTRPGDLYDNVR